MTTHSKVTISAKLGATKFPHAGDPQVGAAQERVQVG